MDIRYSTDPNDLVTAEVEGFFVGWPNPPRPATLIKTIANSDRVVLAFDGDRLVGFITAISDDTLFAFIPLLEVLPNYQAKGIGTELVNRMRRLLGDIYAIDLVCDEDVSGFYTRLGFVRTRSASIRNYASLNPS